MDFQQSFLSALHSNISLTKTISIYDYLPQSLSITDTKEEPLPFVQAYGNIKANFPYYYDISHLDSYCLLFTEGGAGLLSANNQIKALTPGTLAFIDCQERHRIDIQQSPWSYKVFFIKGNPIPFLYASLVTQYGAVHSFPPASAIPNLLKRFHVELTKTQDAFIQSKFILDIILEMLIEKKRIEEYDTHIPEYLTAIKQSFDNNCGDRFSLDMLEREYHISKYQICHEFTAQFGLSPIRYLNQIRIAVAKEELVNTDKRVNEIGRMVGFENTNHFIRLFKQQTGVTPLIFRKQSPV